jgi:tRNA(Arg) A34 adenosine deaminase TadA
MRSEDGNGKIIDSDRLRRWRMLLTLSVCITCNTAYYISTMSGVPSRTKGQNELEGQPRFATYY